MGASVAVRQNEKVNWLLGYYGNEILLGVDQEGGELTRMESKISRGWKKYWLHIVATFDGQFAKLYYNGNLKGEMKIDHLPPLKEQAFMEISGYLENEPYMEIANLVKRLNLYDQALDQKDIQANFESLQEEIESAIIYPELFHFTAGPYLHYATPNSINLSWETNEALKSAFIRYGEVLPLSQIDTVPIKASEKDNYIQTHTLVQLKPGTPYFYELELLNNAGDTIKSGILTFATAPTTNTPITFGVIGDTEARPHVNFQVAKLLWDERPNFCHQPGRSN